MEPLDKRIKDLKDQFEISVEPHRHIGGQMTSSIPVPTIVGKHELLGIEIRLNTYNDKQKNIQLLQTVFDLIFDEMIK